MYGEKPDEFRKRNRDSKLRHPEKSMFRNVRSRAARRGIAFTLKLADIIIPDDCPCCNRTMKMRSGPPKNGATASSPSLDRLNPSRGYVAGNVVVICWRCNELKRNATINELRTILTWMESNQSRPPLRLVS
jgi:hypothetical protein